VALSPGGGELTARGRTVDGERGEWTARVTVPAMAPGGGSGAATALFGRERVEDLEMRRCAAGEDAEAIDREVERIGLAFQIATRLTSWVALDEAPSVDPTTPTRKVRVPQELPYGVSVEGLGLRTRMAPPTSTLVGLMKSYPARAMTPARPGSPSEKHGVGGQTSGLAKRRREESNAEILDELAIGDGFVSPATEGGTALRGRVVKRTGRELIVEIDVAEPMDWAPPDDVSVEGADGVHLHATIDHARSTAAARATAGQTIRLVLTLDHEPAAAPSRLLVGELRIELG
jgi:Ca-activated chloride channel family protein